MALLGIHSSLGSCFEPEVRQNKHHSRRVARNKEGMEEPGTRQSPKTSFLQLRFASGCFFCPAKASN